MNYRNVNVLSRQFMYFLCKYIVYRINVDILPVFIDSANAYCCNYRLIVLIR
jgi:hypothetical protein